MEFKMFGMLKQNVIQDDSPEVLHYFSFYGIFMVFDLIRLYFLPFPINYVA